MKWILIIVAFNAAQPQQPAMLAHKPFTTEYECRDFAEHISADMQRRMANIKVSAFCINEQDLLNSEQK